MSAARVPAADLKRFCERLLGAYGVDEAQSVAVADNVVWSELVGRANFGFVRLPVYVQRLLSGALNGRCHPAFFSISGNLQIVDGDDGFGQYAGAVAMDQAVALAAQTGVGVVGVRNSNFFGTGAYFVHRAAARGMIALAMSNSFPKVAAHGGLRAVLGTNPFAFGAPRRNGESLMIDMATSALAGSTVRAHMQAGRPLPEGLAIDAQGAPLTDPNKVGEGALLPFGGPKGYALALLVEVLAGVLTGAGVGHGVASMYDNLDESGHNGHFLMALDVARWMPMDGYHERMEALIAEIKGSGGADAVLLPGEIRWRTYRDNLENGIVLAEETRAQLARLAAPHDLSLPWR